MSVFLILKMKFLFFSKEKVNVNFERCDISRAMNLFSMF